jgi:hypothetical protein
MNKVAITCAVICLLCTAVNFVWMTKVITKADNLVSMLMNRFGKEW